MCLLLQQSVHKYSKDFLLLFFKKEEKKKKDKNAVKLCEKNLFSAFLFIKYSVRFFRSNQFFLHLVSNRQIYYRHFHYSIQLFHGKEFAAYTLRFRFIFLFFFALDPHMWYSFDSIHIVFSWIQFGF